MNNFYLSIIVGITVGAIGVWYLRRRQSRPDNITIPKNGPPITTNEEAVDALKTSAQLFSKGDVIDAASTLTRIIEFAPNEQEAYWLRAACFFHLKKKKEALNDYEHLVRLDPHNSKYQAAIGDLHFNLTPACVQEALSAYTRAMELDASNHVVIFNRAQCYVKKGEYQKALKDLKKAVSLEPSNIAYKGILAEVEALVASSGDVEDDSDEESEQTFEACVEAIRVNKTALDSMDDAQQLKLYSLFKQATEGPCTKARPSVLDFVGRAKWKAWKECGSMSEKKAKAEYCALVESVLTMGTEREKSTSRKKGEGIGPVFSSLSKNEEVADSLTLLGAAECGDFEGAKKLLEGGADVNERDSDGRTAVMWAADCDCAPLICLLVDKYGARLDLQDNDGMTALHYAAVCGNSTACQALLTRNAPVDVKDSDGNTPEECCEKPSLKELFKGRK